jgi:hypothetical protein
MTEWTPITKVRSSTTWDGGDTIWDPPTAEDGSPGDVAGTIWDPVPDNTVWTRVN